MARVTVVNDNPEFLALMQTILDELGGVESTVLDGDSCSIEDIAATHPQVLLIDLRLGDGTLKGWDLAVLARSHDTLRDPPIIVARPTSGRSGSVGGSSSTSGTFTPSRSRSRSPTSSGC